MSSLKKFLEIHTHTHRLPAINPQQIQIVSPLAFSTTVVAVVALLLLVVAVLLLVSYRERASFLISAHCAA